jgi:virulence-associated protein VagC
VSAQSLPEGSNDGRLQPLDQNLPKAVMETATVIHEGECQTVRLPKGFHISTPTVGVRHEGEAIVLEPIHSKTWPVDFFDSIHITDPEFSRPDQGQMPSVKPL